MFEHLGVIGGQAHEEQQGDGAVDHVQQTEAEHPEQAEQPADGPDDQQGHQTAHEFGAPAGQAVFGAPAVDGHDAEIQRADQEGKHQRGDVVADKDGAEVDAVEHRIPEEQPRGGAGLQLGDPGAEHDHHNQLGNKQQPDQAGGGQHHPGAGYRRGQRHRKGGQQTGAHPAEGFGHELVQGAERAFGIRDVIVAIIHHFALQSPFILGTL